MYLKVKVIASSRLDNLEQISSDTFRAFVKAPAKNNLANRSVARLLAEKFSVPVGRVRLIAGHHSPSKIFDLML